MVYLEHLRLQLADMNAPRITNRQLLQLVSTYWQWRSLWIATTCGFAVLGLIYVLFLKGDTWVASQGLIVRDEANGAVMRLGRFQSQTEMKAAQETVLEMARNTQVLSDALIAVGPEKSWFGWGQTPDAKPSISQIDSLAKDGVAVRAPRGAELGTTEVIYLDVMQSSQARALELNKAVVAALEDRLKQVRQARANGVIAELLAAKEAAVANLKKATDRLQLMEAEAGADLSDLRGLTDMVGSGSSTRQMLDTIKVELRQAELELRQIQVDLEMSRESFEDPTQLLMTPSKLVNASPGLRKLREGLSAASLEASFLKGRFTDEHPLVIAAVDTENQIKSQLRQELGNAVATLTKEYEVATGRVQLLQEQQNSLEDRIIKVAQIRAGYANLASEVKARNEQLQEAERELAQAQAARDAALTSSLITRIDQPLIGEKPVGPGRSTILAGTTACGMFFGFGVVFLLSPIDGSTFGRRKYDYTGAAGRRSADSSMSAAAAAHSAVPTGSAERGKAEANFADARAAFAEGVEVKVPMPDVNLSEMWANVKTRIKPAQDAAMAALQNKIQQNESSPQSASLGSSDSAEARTSAASVTSADAFPAGPADVKQVSFAERESTIVPKSDVPASAPMSQASETQTADVKTANAASAKARSAGQSNSSTDRESLEKAQAIIAAALHCSHSKTDA